MSNKRVLIVEDEFFIAEALAEMMSDLDFDVCGRAETADEAVAIAREHLPELVLMDFRLKGEKDGVDAALAMHSLNIPVIFLTGSREPPTIARIERDHAAAVLFKPFAFFQLKETITQVLRDPSSTIGAAS